jgi:hypothetical protein
MNDFMETTHLDTMRTNIIAMICRETNEKVLNQIERILVLDAPCRYSSAELKQRVLQATESIRAGRGYTLEEMKSLRPDLQ